MLTWCILVQVTCSSSTFWKMTSSVFNFSSNILSFFWTHTENIHYKIRQKVLLKNKQIVVVMGHIINDQNCASKATQINLHMPAEQDCSVFKFPTFQVYLSCDFPSFATDTIYCRPGGFMHLTAYNRGQSKHRVACKSSPNEYFLTCDPRVRRIRCGQLLLPESTLF